MPATLNEPPHRWTWYHHETALKGTCGSLASSGLPLAERLPATTQLLLPCPPSGSSAVAPAGGPPAGRRGYEPGGRMLSEAPSPSIRARKSGPSPSTRFASSG